MAEAKTGGRILVNGEDLSEEVDRISRGGPKTHPQTFEQARDRLVPQLNAVREQIDRIPAELRADRIVVEAEVWANYLAVSYFPSSLVTFMQARPLGSKIVRDGIHSLSSTGETPSVTKSFLLSIDADAVEKVVNLLNGGADASAKTKEEIAQFNNFRVSETHVRSDEMAGEPEALLPFEAVLHPDPDASTLVERAQASDETLEKFSELVESVGGVLHDEWNEVVDGLTFTAIDIPSSGVAKVAAFNPLRSLAPTPHIELSTVIDDVEPVEVLERELGTAKSPPNVLVFDGGVDVGAGVFGGLVDSFDLTGRGLSGGAPEHGAAVTASVIFGELTPGQPLPPAAATVTHYQVVTGPDTDSSEYPWLLRQIKEKVEEHRPSLVNLSLGPLVPVEDREPHRWTAVLDKLARQYGTLFITAAGNNGERDRATGLHRVQVPGDMVNGLCVGAFTNTDDGWAAASYSGRGPGRPGATIQPAVVAFGGDRHHSRFPRLRSDGALVLDGHGTSYAAPLVTNLAAKLSTELGARSDAPTLRALIAHSAERLEDQDVLDVGYGRVPADITEVIGCGPDQVKLIYRGLIGRDEVRSFQLPLPAAATSGKYDLRWTLAFTTGTDSAEAGDYTNAGLETTFRPHSQKFKLAKGTNTRVRNTATQSQEVAELLADGWRLPARPDTLSVHSQFAPEAVLRDHGKWESISRWECTKTGASLHKPTIEISHVTREGGRLTSEAVDIEFSLVVTISSQAGVPLYSLAQSEFSVLAPLPVVIDSDIEVDADVAIES